MFSSIKKRSLENHLGNKGFLAFSLRGPPVPHHVLASWIERRPTWLTYGLAWANKIFQVQCHVLGYHSHHAQTSWPISTVNDKYSVHFWIIPLFIPNWGRLIRYISICSLALIPFWLLLFSFWFISGSQLLSNPDKLSLLFYTGKGGLTCDRLHH